MKIKIYQIIPKRYYVWGVILILLACSLFFNAYLIYPENRFYFGVVIGLCGFVYVYGIILIKSVGKETTREFKCFKYEVENEN